MFIFWELVWGWALRYGVGRVCLTTLLLHLWAWAGLYLSLCNLELALPGLTAPWEQTPRSNVEPCVCTTGFTEAKECTVKRWAVTAGDPSSTKVLKRPFHPVPLLRASISITFTCSLAQIQALGDRSVPRTYWGAVRACPLLCR